MSALRIRDEEREVALAEVRAVLASVPDGDYRVTLRTIEASLDHGELDEDQAFELDRIVTLTLQSGRVRALYGPGGEQALLRLYHRLPGGLEIARSAHAVGDALRQLSGRPLENVRLTARGPGAFALELAAGGLRCNVHLDRQGARLASVEA
jgi:hypothetical protein